MRKKNNFLCAPVRKNPLCSALSAIPFLHLAAAARFRPSPAFPAAQLPFPKSPPPARPSLPNPNPLPPTLTEIGGSGARDAPPTIHVVRHFPWPRVPCDDDALAHLLRLHAAPPLLAAEPGHWRRRLATVLFGPQRAIELASEGGAAASRSTRGCGNDDIHKEVEEEQRRQLEAPPVTSDASALSHIPKCTKCTSG